MSNLRLIKMKAIDSTTIKAKFNYHLDPAINTSNITIVSNTPGIPDCIAIETSIFNEYLTITTRPLTPFALYNLRFVSTDLIKFRSKDGLSYLSNDDTLNNIFLGPEDPGDPVKEFLVQYLKDNIYDIQSGTLVNDALNAQASILSRAIYDARQLYSENYLDVTIENELKTRGAGPYDRLDQEGAFEVIRVSKNLSETIFQTNYSYENFPDYPISLQSVKIRSEELEAGTGFDGLVFTVSKQNVIKLNKLLISYQAGGSAEYDISSFGYQIKEPRYDLDYASVYYLLEDNQFKLNDNILDSEFILPKSGDTVYIDYEYKDLGRVIDDSSISVTYVLQSIRENVPSQSKQFSLKHAPIVTTSDNIQTSGGISFLDPEANPPFSEVHPAFEKEISFRFDRLPNNPGEYSVDYSTGRVFVYGAETNDGTGDLPPVATYNYRKSYIKDFDYTYDTSTKELVANKTRFLAGEKAKISLSYENVLVPGVDYVANVHQEVIDERIQNKLRNSGSLFTKKYPITNVFRVYNETTGEVYSIQRWNNNVVYFDYTVPPNISSIQKEKASFKAINNEMLIVFSETVNENSVKVFKINLKNNRIGSASEDSIGSSFNSSAAFSRTDIFEQEIYFDGQTQSVTDNINRLSSGDYEIDYVNGIVYVGVTESQTHDLGTINYKTTIIEPSNPHVISVSDIYFSINSILGVNKRIGYTSINESYILPNSYELSDERFLSDDVPFVYDGGTIKVKDDIKDVRGIYDHYDLTHSNEPTNFADGCSVSANIITLSDVSTKKTYSLSLTGYSFDLPFISDGVEISSIVSVVRSSDGAELWNEFGVFSGYTVSLSGVTVSLGDEVAVTYTVKLNGSSTPIVDYSRGDLYIDYSYLADEILISYEYGDNNIDFRNTDSLSVGENYFVTYKIGALRESLLRNFGSLINLPILNDADLSVGRENYRDAIKAALQSFTKGPTIPALKLIAHNIAHMEPEIIEGIFANWSLGSSMLYPSKINTTGDLGLHVGKFDYGVLVKNNNETITLPLSSNLRLNEGTFETWVTPQWDGIDNDATLTFSIKKDGQPINNYEIFIGATSFNPTLTADGKFTLNRLDNSSPVGLPYMLYTAAGVFIYYDEDLKKWKLLVKNATDSNVVYSGEIVSSGEIYDAKFIPGLGEITDTIRSGTNSITFEMHIDAEDELYPDGYIDGYSLQDGYYPLDGYSQGYSFDGIQFMADDEHYIFDAGIEESRNRFSIYKDGRGYLNFRVFDKGNQNKRNKFIVSSDISSWKAGEQHHIATSWVLNSYDRRDEMHLFIDGQEVPNIIKYGGRPEATSTDRFRTVKPEYVLDLVPKKTITGSDLVTEINSYVVTSDSIDFEASGIQPGDTITIFESGLSEYTINSVVSNSLTLNSLIPVTLSNVRYSINKYSTIVSSEIDCVSNFTVSIIHNGEETEIPGMRSELPGYSVSKNLNGQNVLTLLGNADAGDQIVIRTLGLNHRRFRDRVFVWGNSTNILRTTLAPPMSLDDVKIIANLLPMTYVGPGNSSIVSDKFLCVLSDIYQPTNQTEGRTISVRITGQNVSFSEDVTVSIIGITAGVDTLEVLTFNSPGTKTTTNKFLSISSVGINVKPNDISKNSIGVEVKEAYSVTYSEGNEIYPVIRYSYKTQFGSGLESTDDNDIVKDLSGFFAQSSVGQSLVIQSPVVVAGTYNIIEKIDNNTIKISPPITNSFSSGVYSIYNTSIGRSGFQNGFFTLELAGGTNVAYPLPEGWYEFDYMSYLEVPLDPIHPNVKCFVGSDVFGNKQAKCVIDEVKILSTKLTDVRIGETSIDGQSSITKDYLSLKRSKPNQNTLALIRFDSKPFLNSSDVWVGFDKTFVQSADSVNSNFGKSVVLTENPLIIDNAGLLDTSSELSIEFWVSPRYDTYNDPEFRFYFDATGSLIEDVTSLSSATLKVSNRTQNIIGIYGVSDIGLKNNFAIGATINADGKTIKLSKSLPYQNMPLKVNYIPTGLAGDRISIYKDREGFITLNVRSGGIDYQVRQPVFWVRDSWHRIRTTFKLNSKNNNDEIRLFVDGEERGTILFGQGLLFSQDVIFSQGFAGVNNSVLTADINFKDPINQLYIGSDYMKNNKAYARMDNLKISNKAKKPIYIAGQPFDANYSGNTSLVYPSVEDVYTTYLLNFDTLVKKETDFALLKNGNFGINDFTMNINDSFGIISGNSKIKQIFEILINALRPAQSRATLNYLT